MGRRALPKLEASLDVSRHLLRLETLTPPLDAASLFGREAPLEVEIGSGKGLFLARASLARPEHNFLGIEVAYRYAHFAAAQLAARGGTNALMLHGDALHLFAAFLRNAAATAVHVYFPDPWWKRRHHKRRVMQQPFLQQIERVLAPGGELHFWTDVEAYSRAACADIAAATGLQGHVEVSEQPTAEEQEYQTHFERRTRLGAKPVFRALYRKPLT